MWRRAVIGAIGAALVALTLGGVAHAATSAPDTSSEAAFVQRINAERAGAGAGSAQVASDLVAVARQHSEDMANQQRLFDDTNVGNEVQNWQSVAANSGEGPSVQAIDQAFMASPPHRANIVDPRYTQVGVGVVWTGATMWVTEVFRQPWSGSASTSPPPPSNPPPPTTQPPPPPPAPTPPPTAPPVHAVPTPPPPATHTVTQAARAAPTPTTTAAPPHPANATVAPAGAALSATAVTAGVAAVAHPATAATSMRRVTASPRVELASRTARPVLSTRGIAFALLAGMAALLLLLALLALRHAADRSSH